jgi:hypothetical protein
LTKDKFAAIAHEGEDHGPPATRVVGMVPPSMTNSVPVASLARHLA